MIGRRKKEIKKKIVQNCFFCDEKKSPQWQDYDQLKRFLSPRGRILPRSISGLCHRHQKQTVLAIKQARHLALLPFVVE